MPTLASIPFCMPVRIGPSTSKNRSSSADATTVPAHSPIGSDLWLDEFQQTDILIAPLQLPSEMSVLVAASCGALAGFASISAIRPFGLGTGGSTEARPSVLLRVSARRWTFGRSALPFGVLATIWNVPLKPAPKPSVRRS